MAVQSIAGPAALPAEGPHTIYVRSDIEPRYIISGKGGLVFERADGCEWDHDGYHVEKDYTGIVTHRPANRIIEGKK